jgi:hypothetical protein
MNPSVAPRPARRRLSAHITRRRVAYSLAAAASSGTAQAAIVYSGPQNIAINQFSSLNLNIDGDAYGDVLLKNYVFGGGNYQGATVNFFPGKMVTFNPGAFNYVTALNSGFTIDTASLATGNFTGSMAYGAANPNAQFNSAAGKFIGLQFPSGPNNYNAWVRVNVNNSAGSFTVVDWAYENVSGQPIVTGVVPEPSTLGLLAAGAAGVAALRRRRPAA